MKTQTKRSAIILAGVSTVSATAVALTVVAWPTGAVPTTSSTPARDSREKLPESAPPPSGPITFAVDAGLTPSSTAWQPPENQGKLDNNVETHRYALLAGTTPDQAVTMTAIALAESGGNTQAHNAWGEDSRGLWQINAPVQPRLEEQDLFDPPSNARAALDGSQSAGDISPWTTTHGIGDAKYVHSRDEAAPPPRLYGRPSNAHVAISLGSDR